MRLWDDDLLPPMPDMPPTRPYVALEELGRLRRSAVRVGRNWRWLREQGWRAFVDEHGLYVPERTANTVRRWRWRHAHSQLRGDARPVFVVGVQRSGTNMVVRGLAALPEIEVRSENDRRVFERFKLRSTAHVVQALESSRYPVVLFKPLCDSHRTDELLDGLGRDGPGRAIWVYRGMEGRVRSAVTKFGEGNLAVLRDYAAGRGTDRWQVQRISAANAELIRSFDFATLSPASGAALFWYVRNSLYFDLGLDRRDDVLLLNYDLLLAAPIPVGQGVARFLDVPWRPAMVAHVRSSGPNGHRAALDIHPEIRARCDALETRLASASG